MFFFTVGIASSGFVGGYGGYTQLRPFPMKVAALTFNRRTTTFRPLYASYQPVPVLESAISPEESDSSPISPSNWIDLFEHDETHVNITVGNETLSLLWNDELVISNPFLNIETLIQTIFVEYLA